MRTPEGFSLSGKSRLSEKENIALEIAACGRMHGELRDYPNLQTAFRKLGWPAFDTQSDVICKSYARRFFELIGHPIRELSNSSAGYFSLTTKSIIILFSSLLWLSPLFE